MAWWFGDPNCINDVWKEPDRELYISCAVTKSIKETLIGSIATALFILVCLFIAYAKGYYISGTICVALLGMLMCGGLYYNYKYSDVIAGIAHDNMRRRIYAVSKRLTNDPLTVFDNFSKKPLEEQGRLRTAWTEASSMLMSEELKSREVASQEMAAQGARNIGQGQQMQGVAALGNAVSTWRR